MFYHIANLQERIDYPGKSLAQRFPKPRSPQYDQPTLKNNDSVQRSKALQQVKDISKITYCSAMPQLNDYPSNIRPQSTNYNTPS